MCVMSMVHDHFGKKFDDFWGIPLPQIEEHPITGKLPTTTLIPVSLPTSTEMPFVVLTTEQNEMLKNLIKEFREAVAAAKTIDRLTNQPDCLDPEKGKLEMRVAELEMRIKTMEALTKAKKAKRPVNKKRTR
jgi:hypothetical protein